MSANDVSDRSSDITCFHFTHPQLNMTSSPNYVDPFFYFSRNIPAEPADGPGHCSYEWPEP